jgi:RHS repeat-associated protein
VKKQINTARNWYLSDGADEIAEYTGITANTLAYRYVPGPAIDQPIAMVTAAGAKTYFHADKRGSVIAMSNSSGNMTEGPFTYDACGNMSGGTTGVPYRYVGRRYDSETGLLYNRARYLSTNLCRFLQTDSAGYKPDMNLYAYTYNDPVNRVDPLGLYSCGNSMSPDQCGEFTKAQDAAKTQITGAISTLKSLKADLAAGKPTAEDKQVSATLDKYLGKGAGSSVNSIDRLIGSATKMLGVLSGNMPAQFGASSGSDYARADPGQLTVFKSFFANPNSASASIQRTQTLAHESSHHALNALDWGLYVGKTYIPPYGQANAISRAKLWPEKTWDVPDSLTFALGFRRTDEPEN